MLNIHSTIRQVSIIEPMTSYQSWEVYGVTGFLNAFPTLELAIAWRENFLNELVRIGG